VQTRNAACGSLTDGRIHILRKESPKEDNPAGHADRLSWDLRMQERAAGTGKGIQPVAV